MDEENTEVLFESWGFKHAGTEKKKSLRITSSWKKQYFILFREDRVSKVLCYEKKPKNVKEKPKLVFDLFPEYSLKKQFDYRGKPYACVLVNKDCELCAGFEEEKIFHLFCFFVQTQTHLREEYEVESFVVRPESSDEHRKLGSRGNMCLLHISQCGVILALQLSKCVLAQWPLKSIKWYESSGRQQFVFEAGRKSPMGPGTYVFKTRSEQDNMMYDRLDSFVMEVAGLKQFTQSSNLLTNEGTDNISMSSQLLSLQSLTTVYSDGRFTATLKRISRDIYDHLSQHLGGSVSSSRPIGSPSTDPFSDSTFNRSKSTNGSHRITPTTPSTPQQHALPHPVVHQAPHPISPISHVSSETHSPVVKPKVSLDNSFGPVPTGRPYENDFVEKHVVTARKIKQNNFSSSYLIMNSTASPSPALPVQGSDTPSFSTAAKVREDTNTMVTRALPEYSNYTHNPTQSQYPVTRHTPSSPKPIPRLHLEKNQALKAGYVLAKRMSDPKESATSSVPRSHPERHDAAMVPIVDSYSPVTGDSVLLLERQKLAISNEYTDKDLLYYNNKQSIPLGGIRRPRLQSQSLEDFSQYERMSKEDLAISNYLYHNEGFRMSDEVSSPPRVTGNKLSPGIYSYASPSALKKGTPESLGVGQEYNSIGEVSAVANSLGSPPLPALRTVDFLKLRDIYARPLPRAIRRSRSIPTLTKGREFNDTSYGTNDRSSGTGRVSFENNNTIKYFISDHPDQVSPVESLAFANNMFKEELDTLKQGNSPVKNVTSGDGTSSVSPSKPSVKPKPVLSLFKREISRDSASSSTTSGIRSMSTSPISPFPSSNVKSTNPGVKGIMFTPKTKSFKRPAGEGGGTSNNRDSGELGTRRISGESITSGNVLSGELSIKRRTGSSGSAENKMEGRRLPSLPPDAILNEDLEEMGTAYAKVEETLC